MMPAAGHGDAGDARIVQLRREQIQAAAQFLDAPRRNGLGQAEACQRDVEIMDQQIEDASSALRSVAQPQRPRRRRAAPPEQGLAHLSLIHI